MIVDPDAAIENCLIQIENILNDLGHVMGDIKLLKKWKNVIETQGETIKSLQENIRKCVTYDLVYQHSQNNEAWQAGAIECLNDLTRKVNVIEHQIVGLLQEQTIKKFNLPSIDELNNITRNELNSKSTEEWIDHTDELKKENIKLRDEITELKARLNNLLSLTSRNTRFDQEYQQMKIHGGCKL